MRGHAVDLVQDGVVAGGLECLGCVLGLPEFTYFVVGPSDHDEIGVEVKAIDIV